MKPPAKLRFSRQGLLLVEAILAAVVIATALVFVSRSLGGQLNTVRSLEQYQVLSLLAQSKLDELQGMAAAQIPLGAADLDGTFDAPYDNYRWEVETRPRQDVTTPEGASAASDVSVTVSRIEGRPGSFTLHAVWLAEWLAR